MFIRTSGRGFANASVSLSITNLAKAQKGLKRILTNSEAAVRMGERFGEIAKQKMLMIYDATKGRKHQERQTGTLRKILAVGPVVRPTFRGAIIDLINFDWAANLGSSQGGVLHPGFNYFEAQEFGHRSFSDKQPFVKIYIGSRKNQSFTLESINKIDALNKMGKNRVQNVVWINVHHPAWGGRRFIQAGREAWKMYKNNKRFLKDFTKEFKEALRTG